MNAVTVEDRKLRTLARLPEDEPLEQVMKLPLAQSGGHTLTVPSPDSLRVWVLRHSPACVTATPQFRLTSFAARTIASMGPGRLDRWVRMVASSTTELQKVSTSDAVHNPVHGPQRLR